MDRLKHISQVFNSADEILFDDSSKFILMSDCHRGDGSWSDDFARNQNIYFSALVKYYHENYTYIELGDGDELWENNICEAIQTHNDVFWLLSKFYKEGRLFFIYGNHDMVKKSKRFVKKHLFQYFNESSKEYCFLFPNIKIHEGLVLKHRITGRKILLIHGHQVDFLNYTLWEIARFLVRYIWRPLNLFGVNDPTRPAKIIVKKKK
ncbi:metallophosphoesterase [Defluviitalea phaphyphila]|uniref:metallophosphoesterase n=1 Tax=Defluviitalea phaphyphila TaxID=1473580 RepID=UPI000B04C28F|nr:metallophosphoesterase [Defluviitalea phaphyphila]